MHQTKHMVGEATKKTPRYTGGKIERGPFVPAYPITDAVSEHPHVCDQENKCETASMEGKKTKQKAGISHKEVGQKGKGCMLHGVHSCILNTSYCA